MLKPRLSEWGAFKNCKPQTYPRRSSSQIPIQPKPPDQSGVTRNLQSPAHLNIHDMACGLVEEVVSFEFSNNKEAATFDLIWMSSGRDYQASWQKLSHKSAALPRLARLEDKTNFRKAVGEVLASIPATFQQQQEVILLVSLWRICRDLLDTEVVRQGGRLIHRLFGTLLRERKMAGCEWQKDPLMKLCMCVLAYPYDGIHELLRIYYGISISCLRNRFAVNNFTVPQMTTDYLTNWDGRLDHFSTLTADFESLVEYSKEINTSLSWRTIVCQHQFLDYAFSIKKDQVLSRSVAAVLYGSTDTIISNQPNPPWDSVTRAWFLAAKVLSSCHAREVRETCGGGGNIEEAFQLNDKIYETLSKGDERCQAAAKEFAGLFGEGSEDY